MCTVTQQDIKKACGVQVCETVAIKKTHYNPDSATDAEKTIGGKVKVVECGKVATSPCSGPRQFRVVGKSDSSPGALCPTSTCETPKAGQCYDVDQDGTVDATDATIVFTAGSVPKAFGGVDLVKDFLNKRQTPDAATKAKAYHNVVTVCRHYRKYSFTSSFTKKTDRFDFVAFFVLVTVPKQYGAESLLAHKVQKSESAATSKEIPESQAKAIVTTAVSSMRQQGIALPGYK